MKASDVVAQLTNNIAKRTNLFSNDISVTSLTLSGSTVTAVCASPHELITGDKVIITGAIDLNPITSLTFADGVVSATTKNNHDLTKPSDIQVNTNDLYSFNQAPVSGASESEYNGTFVLLEVPNRKSFQYQIPGTPGSPATGSPALEQYFDYNGEFAVTVIDPTTFTYQISGTPESPAVGAIIARVGFRISAAVDLQRAMDSYTAQATNSFWAFVVLGRAVPSRNRRVLSDATNEQSQQTEYRARLIEPFSVFVFAQAVDSLSGRNIQDVMEDVRGYIYHSLAGYRIPTALNETAWSKTTPLGDGYVREISTQAVYVHEFSFERVVDVTYPDTIGPDENRAFRDAGQTIKFPFGTGELTADTNLDEQPL